MKNFQYKPSGVCSRLITFDIDDNKVYNVSFTGGCDGNLKAISKLVEGMEVNKLKSILEGNQCGIKGTSCADQLAKAVNSAMHDISESNAT